MFDLVPNDYYSLTCKLGVLSAYLWSLSAFDGIDHTFHPFSSFQPGRLSRGPLHRQGVCQDLQPCSSLLKITGTRTSLLQLSWHPQEQALRAHSESLVSEDIMATLLQWSFAIYAHCSGAALV